MQVYNQKSYYNSIYLAIIVNSDITQDPLNIGRVQIYIPGIQYEYDGVYKQYMNSTNKTEDKYFGCFPWATTLISDLTNGQYVYGSFVNNNNGDYIVLGVDVNNNHTKGVGGDTLEGLDIVSLVMPVIIMEETGYGKSDCPRLPQWPDGFPDDIFHTIEDNSTSARGIGILQWTASRAFDLLYDIAIASNGSWKDCWSDKSLDLYKDLLNAVTNGSSSSYRNNNAMCSAMAKDGPIYTGVKNMLNLSASRKVQEAKAPNDAQTSINILKDSPYNITNPGIIIFYTDIMNQYGNGVNKVITNCLTDASKIDKNGEDLISQVTEVFNNWTSKTSQYKDRRQRVYSYISWLNEQGKLTNAELVDIGDLANSDYIPEVGEYLWPCSRTTYITAYWGDSTVPYNYSFTNYNSKNKVMGYGSMSTWHAGVDFGCPQGEEAIAVGNGTVAYVCSPEEGQSGGQGGCIILQMDKNPDYYFAYMHLREKPSLNVGDKVKAGQVVGYTGNTGHSTGPHLHLGLHIKAPWGYNGKARDSRIDPLPKLGKKANT